MYWEDELGLCRLHDTERKICFFSNKNVYDGCAEATSLDGTCAQLWPYMAKYQESIGNMDGMEDVSIYSVSYHEHVYAC